MTDKQDDWPDGIDQDATFDGFPLYGPAGKRTKGRAPIRRPHPANADTQRWLQRQLCGTKRRPLGSLDDLQEWLNDKRRWAAGMESRGRHKEALTLLRIVQEHESYWLTFLRAAESKSAKLPQRRPGRPANPENEKRRRFWFRVLRSRPEATPSELLRKACLKGWKATTLQQAKDGLKAWKRLQKAKIKSQKTG